MTIHETHLANLRALQDELGGIENVAALSGVDISHLRNVINGKILPSGNRAGIGPRAARKLEAGAGKPTGWFDRDHEPVTPIHPDDLRLTAAEQMLVHLYRRAGPERQWIIQQIARLGSLKKD